MKSEVVASLIIAGTGLGWTIYTYLPDKEHFLREKKAEFFQRVLASEEELHEAYFDENLLHTPRQSTRIGIYPITVGDVKIIGPSLKDIWLPREI